MRLRPVLLAGLLLFAILSAEGAVFVVSSSADGGSGTLRQAILDANANPGPDVIHFNLPPGDLTIAPASLLPEITDPVTIDGTSQPGFAGVPLVELSGASAGTGADGLHLTAGHCTVRGLVINQFRGDGIELNGGGTNVITGNIIGLDPTGAVDRGNSRNGILIQNSPDNIIGGASAAERNVISGNNSDGVEIAGAGSTGNHVLGNYLGTDLTGSLDVGNSTDGVYINGAANNLIGGTAAGEGNVLSGNNRAGVTLQGSAASNNRVLGNRIGVDASGLNALKNNSYGVWITSSAHDNTIGGTEPGAANQIAFNGNIGVLVSSGVNNRIRGNAIYSNANLEIDLAPNGVTPNDAGDTDSGANLRQNFPVITNATSSVSGAVIEGSLSSQSQTTYTIDVYAASAPDDSGAGQAQYYLGAVEVTTDDNGQAAFRLQVTSALSARWVSATATDPDGNTSELGPAFAATSTIPPQTFMVVNTNDSGPGSLREAITSALNQPASGPNRIEFNIPGPGPHRIQLQSPLPELAEPMVLDGFTQPGATPNSQTTTDNAVRLIWLDGSQAGSGADGLHVSGSGVVVRGLILTGFDGDGIEIAGGGENQIAGNCIGLMPDQTPAGNRLNGVLVHDSTNNTVGGTTLADRNVIAGNSQHGVRVEGADATGNQILGNFIGLDATGTNAAVNGRYGVSIYQAASNQVGGASVAMRNVISGNYTFGVDISGTGATGNRVQGNFIGTDATGTRAIGNRSDGVHVSGVADNLVGGTDAGEGNLISGNVGNGVAILNPTATGNRVQGNLIGTDVSGTIELGNSRDGVVLNNGVGNWIGGTEPQAGNVISGNEGRGIYVVSSKAATNVIQGNFIGTDRSGQIPLGNEDAGIVLYLNAHDNVIGGLETGAANVIAFNEGSGVFARSGVNNAIRANAIYENEGLGIDLDRAGVDLNDADDADTGANQLQNFPVLTQATITASNVTVAGTLQSEPNQTYAIDLFASFAGDLSGYGEGRQYLGTIMVTTDGSGAASFAETLSVVAAGRTMTATATDPSGNTSEFSPSLRAEVDVPGTAFVVTTAADAGPGSLRQAILDANSHVSGGDLIRFAIPGSGVQTIALATPLPPLTEPVTIDGYTQPGAQPNTLPDDNNAVLRIRLDGSGLSEPADGLRLWADGCVIRGLCIVGFGGAESDGIEIDIGASNVVAGNFIGVDVDGATTRTNGGHGIHIASLTQDAAASTRANRIGGETPADRNVIAGNVDGVHITESSGNVVAGNFIGTDASGRVALTNLGSGVVIRGPFATNNLVGGLAPGARNVISGNGSLSGPSSGRDGVQIYAGTGNHVQGNFIGTDVTGSAPLPNFWEGVRLSGGASDNWIGSAQAGAGNVISGNAGSGIVLEGRPVPAARNHIAGNFIGADVTGTSPVPNQSTGITQYDAGTNYIGGVEPGAGNLISGNARSGVRLLNAPGVVIQGNIIGADISGAGPLSNTWYGIEISGSRDSHLGVQVGGTDPGAANIIAFNGLSGVLVSSGMGVSILGNSIFANIELGIDIGPEGVTTNDLNDVDSGANQLQNFPELWRAAVSPDETVVWGTLQSIPLTDFRLEFFANTECGQGERFLGATTVTTDEQGETAFEAHVPGLAVFGEMITATATDPDGNTSEFSACQRTLPIESADLKLTVVRPPAGSPIAEDFTLEFTITNQGPARATGVVLTHRIPPGVTFVGGTASQGSCRVEDGTVVCALGTMEDQAVATGQLTFHPLGPGAVQFRLVATGEQFDPIDGDNFLQTFTRFGLADLGVSFETFPTNAVAGQQVRYVASITNAGPDTASAARLFMTFDWWFVAESYTASQGEAEPFGEVGNQIIAELGSLPVGGTASLEVTGRYVDSGNLQVAAGSSNGLEADPLAANNRLEDHTVVQAGPGVLWFWFGEWDAREGQPYAVVGVWRTGGTQGEVGVSFYTKDGTAVAGQDYTSTNGVLRFADGVDELEIRIPILDDADPECNEWFQVTLDHPTGGATLGPWGIRTVVNVFEDDLPPMTPVQLISAAHEPQWIPGGAFHEFGGSDSYNPSVSADGRWVAFESDAVNFAHPDSNEDYTDVFVLDRQSRTMILVSANRDGTDTGNDDSEEPLISADGRVVAFESWATDLVDNDRDDDTDVYVRDLTQNRTELVSVNTNGVDGNASSYLEDLSADGQVIVFSSEATDLVALPDTNETKDLFLRDLATGTTELITRNTAGTAAANEGGSGAWLTANGRFVAFSSSSSDLVERDANGSVDAFVYDRQTGGVSLVSENTNGVSASGKSWAAGISDDGRYVAFESDAPDLVPGDHNASRDVFLRDMQTGEILLVSHDGSGTATANGDSYSAAMSGDGRFVLFHTWADTLAPNDQNNAGDVFLWDRLTGSQTLISVNREGTGPGNDWSQGRGLSADGRYVLFRSGATNLTEIDVPAHPTQLYLRDVQTGRTRLVSRGIGGEVGNDHPWDAQISASGDVVVWHTAADNLTPLDLNQDNDVFAYDIAEDNVELISGVWTVTGEAGSWYPMPSADGRYVFFESEAGSLVPSDGNWDTDVFRHDLTTGETELVSINQSGTGSGNWRSYNFDITPDGRFVSFESFASDLTPGDTNGATDVFVRDLVAGQTTLVSVDTNGVAGGGARFPAISADGRSVVFQGYDGFTSNDTNRYTDVFLADWQAGLTRLISLRADGLTGGNDRSGPGFISPNRRFVLFESSAWDLVPGDTFWTPDWFVFDLQSGRIELLAPAVDGGYPNQRMDVEGVFSWDGRYTVFSTGATNLVPGDTNEAEDVFVRDLFTRQTLLVSVNAAGTGPGNGHSDEPRITPDGRFVVFTSEADDLVPGDTNGLSDIFVRDLRLGVTRLVTRNCSGGGANGDSEEADLSADGRFVVFNSDASDLVPGSYIRDYFTGERRWNVFLHDRQLGQTWLVSHDPTGREAGNRDSANSGEDDSGRAQITPDGGLVVFASRAHNLVAGDNNAAADVFAWRPPRHSPVADLEVSPRWSSAQAGIGESVQVRVTVQNHGPVAATSVTLTISPPVEALLGALTLSQGTQFHHTRDRAGSA